MASCTCYWSHRSKINFFLYEAVEFTGKPLTEGGLPLGYIWANGKYEAAAFGRNITDTRPPPARSTSTT